MSRSPSSRLAARPASPWRRPSRAAALVLAAITPAVLLGPSCLLGGFERVDAPEAAPDAAPDVAPDVDVEQVGCTNVPIPPPPADDAGHDAGGDITFVSALRTIDLGDTDTGGPPIGFDLDRTCTCLGEGPTCRPRNLAPDAGFDFDAGTGGGCDYPGGIDNAGTVLFRILKTASGGSFGSQFYTELAEVGGWSLLFRVRGYNGEVNDPQVTLDWFVAPNFGGMTPQWNGMDAWPVQDDSVIGGSLDTPKYTDSNAFVTEGVLVASLPEGAAIKLGEITSTITMRLTGLFVVAEIGAVPGVADHALVRGTIAGRWTLDEAFRSVSSYRDETGAGYCINDLFYDVAKQQICNAADIPSGTAGPTAPCDALSLGLAFTAYPAQLGVVQPPGPPPGPACAPEFDPANDSCDAL